MRLLLVEDDPRIAVPLIGTLREAGYSVVHCADGPSGLAEGRSGAYPLMVLDVMLPGLDGFALAKTLRQEGVNAAILFLTARGELQDRVQGLDLGGDAYLVKPFERAELLATLRAISRKGSEARTAQLGFGQGRGVLDAAGRVVRWDGAEVAVTGREYALLETLLLGRGRWFTREELLERVWGLDFGGEARIVDVYIRYLRRKLSPEVIASERGRGYRVESE
ncbi:response regulator transcription factor [Deinococcus sp. KNUC1210]|uniref:response regulator transcription factor n=1 Tax=Deinococcus sp. KNUC1210 TaxID=2917691 RepID=UPI001EEFB0C3|nr:response regulator transcription factor [Deinococcus sp. KNUC1210]ULH14525.1 response regulator transcription factor [Deinococcus sp. KNUC1210]